MNFSIRRSGTMVSSTIVDPVKPDLSVLRLELLVVLEVSPLAQVRRRSVLVEVQVVRCGGALQLVPWFGAAVLSGSYGGGGG